MLTDSSTSRQRPARARRSPGPLPPPPPGVAVLTREQAAEFLGVALGTFGIWEREGRVTITRYRAVSGTGRAMFYAAEDLARLREELSKLEQPYPDPEHPGVYRVPIRSRLHAVEALVDAEDLPKVRGKGWNVRVSREDRKTEVILSSVTERIVPLQRLIMGVESAECRERIVQFVNGNPLDCRRANLVIRTRSEVNRCRAKTAARAGRPTSSTYKGVDWDAKRRFWRAQIATRGNHRQLGRFRDEAQAAAAYDTAARELFGDSAALNFPDGSVPAPTYLGPDGEPVREKNAYRVPRGLPAPPPGAAMLTREAAAAALDISERTLGQWEREGDLACTRYRAKDQTGTPILYAAADIARLREELDKVGQPYADPHPARAGVWRVPLRTLGGYIEALIDEGDLGIVQGRKWNFALCAAKRNDKGSVFLVGPRDVERVQLKRLIMGLQDQGPEVRITHANGNPLDCRRANLIVCGAERSTRRGFKILQRSGRPTSSRFKGVCWNEREGKWLAQIRVDDKQRRLGMFNDEEDAAYTYDEAARELWGAGARVNFPEPGELPSAAAPVNPAELSAEAPEARPPVKPTDFAAVLNPDGSVTISWRSGRSAASAGATFAVSRRLPGQTGFMRIGTAGGSTAQNRRPLFTDATVPAEHLAPGAAGSGAEYIVQGSRGEALGEASDVLVVRFDADGTFLLPERTARAA